MKIATKLSLISATFFAGVQQVFAVPAFNTPEIDTSSAALGIGLMVGLVALVSECRRK